MDIRFGLAGEMQWHRCVGAGWGWREKMLQVTEHLGTGEGQAGVYSRDHRVSGDPHQAAVSPDCPARQGHGLSSGGGHSLQLDLCMSAAVCRTDSIHHDLASSGWEPCLCLIPSDSCAVGPRGPHGEHPTILLRLDVHPGSRSHWRGHRPGTHMAWCGAGRGRVLWSAQLLTPLVLSFSDWPPHCGVSVVPRRWAVASGSSCAAIILTTCLQGLAARSREGPLPSPQPGPRSTCPVPKAWGGQDSSGSLGRGCWGQNQSRSGLQPSP